MTMILLKSHVKEEIPHVHVISRLEAKALGLKRYFTGVPCKRGHVSERQVSNHVCFECNAELLRERYSKPAVRSAFAKRHKEKMADPIKREAERHRDRVRRSDPNRLESMKYRMRERRRDTIDGNILRERARLRYAERSKSDELYVASTRLRSATKAAFSRFDLKKPRRTESLLGCTISEAKRQIEKQWLHGMSWICYGTSWHIDHIVPLASAKSVADMELLCRIGNLRPMWAENNLSKGSKKTHLI